MVECGSHKANAVKGSGGWGRRIIIDRVSADDRAIGSSNHKYAVGVEVIHIIVHDAQ